MKKNSFIILSSFMILLSSCSTNNDKNVNPIVPAVALVKKIIQSDSNGRVYTTTTFTYEGNKIINEIIKKNDISMGVDVGYNYRNEYTYTGNLITNIKVKNVFATPESLISNTDLVYDGNENLISSTKIRYLLINNNMLRIVYEKLDNNSVHCTMFGSSTSDNIETLGWDGKLTFDANRNLVKSESMDSALIYGSYLYDTKFNPKKNILGLNKLIFFDTAPNYSSNYLFYFLDRFNTILKSNISGYFPTTNQYTYRADGYPTEMKQYSEYLGNTNLEASYQYFY